MTKLIVPIEQLDKVESVRCELMQLYDEKPSAGVVVSISLSQMLFQTSKLWDVANRKYPDYKEENK